MEQSVLSGWCRKTGVKDLGSTISPIQFPCLSMPKPPHQIGGKSRASLFETAHRKNSTTLFIPNATDVPCWFQVQISPVTFPPRSFCVFLGGCLSEVKTQLDNWTLHRNEELKEICMVECGNIAVLMYWKWFETKNSHLERWTDSDRLIMIDYDCLVDWLYNRWLIMTHDWWLIVIDWLVTCCLHDFTAFWIGWLDQARIHCTWERFLCIYPTIGGYQTKIIRKYQRHHHPLTPWGTPGDVKKVNYINRNSWWPPS